MTIRATYTHYPSMVVRYCDTDEPVTESSVSPPGDLKEYDVPPEPPSGIRPADDLSLWGGRKTASGVMDGPLPHINPLTTAAARDPIPMDTVRSTYRELSDAEKADLLGLKTAGQNLIDYINSLRSHGKGTQRELALALTKAEESVMWATKGLTG
jgi:hypothetical protein